MKSYKNFFFIVIFFSVGSMFGMDDMRERLCKQWRSDKTICVDRMNKASEQRKVTVYVNEDGKLRGKFDGTTHKAITYFDDGSFYENDFTQLYDFLQRSRPTRYLRDGKIYDRGGKVIADVSIAVMHKKSKKKRCIIS